MQCGPGNLPPRDCSQAVCCTRPGAHRPPAPGTQRRVTLPPVESPAARLRGSAQPSDKEPSMTPPELLAQYGPREALEDDVPREVKEERLARVLELQHAIDAEKLSEYHGTVQEVLIDAAHPRKQGWLNGRTDSYRAISFYAPEHEIGDMVQVEVKGHTGYWLEGELVGATAAGEFVCPVRS